MRVRDEKQKMNKQLRSFFMLTKGFGSIRQHNRIALPKPQKTIRTAWTNQLDDMLISDQLEKQTNLKEKNALRNRGPFSKLTLGAFANNRIAQPKLYQKD